MSAPLSIQRLKRQEERPVAGAAILSEAFPATAADAGAVGFVLAKLRRRDRPILWVQDRLSRREAGMLYLPGMGAKRTLLQVDVSRAADALWSMEEGLRCKGLSAVVAEIWGDPPALSFTATKRLALRAEAAGIPCWLIRRAASPDLSAARDRWRIASLPSAPAPHDRQAPGDPRWRVELFRSRAHRPGTWVATYERAKDHLHLAAPFRDGAVAEATGPDRQRAAG
ncbi:MAG: hypothetical protein AAF367_00485 [Pseudomonadota bacterium]